MNFSDSEFKSEWYLAVENESEVEARSANPGSCGIVTSKKSLVRLSLSRRRASSFFGSICGPARNTSPHLSDEKRRRSLDEVASSVGQRTV